MVNAEVIVGTGEAKIIAPGEIARNGDLLEGSFISCLVYRSGRASFGQYGPHPSFCELHLRKIRQLQEDIGEVVSRGFLFTRDTDPEHFFGLNMSLDTYVASRDAFVGELAEIASISIDLRTYLYGNVIRLGLNRIPSVNSF